MKSIKSLTRLMSLSLLILPVAFSYSCLKESASAPSNIDQGLQEVPYEIVSSTTWKINEDIMEARLERSTSSLASLPPDVPFARFTIENKRSGKVVYSKVDDAFPTTVQKENFSVDGKDVISAKWTAGGASSLEIYTVTQAGASIILNATFKDAYILQLSPKGGDFAQILTVNSSLDTNRLIIERYRWNGKKFASNGQANYDEFIKTMDRQFK